MDKFEEFQTTMAKSNELFTTFRQEMEKVFIVLPSFIKSNSEMHAVSGLHFRFYKHLPSENRRNILTISQFHLDQKIGYKSYGRELCLFFLVFDILK